MELIESKDNLILDLGEKQITIKGILISFVIMFVFTFLGTKSQYDAAFALFKGLFVVFPLLLLPTLRSGKPLFYYLGLALSVMHILTLVTKWEYFDQQIDMFMLELIIPLMSIVVASKIGSKDLWKLNVYLNIGIILACLPYLLDLAINMKVSDELYDLKKYGENGSLFTGFFRNVHNAAITLSVSVIVLCFRLNDMNKKYQRFILKIIIGIGILCIYKTYVRTAWLMLVVAYIFNFFYSRKTKRNLRNYFIASLLGSGALIYIFYTSEVVQMRLTERNVYNSGALSIGSGRLVFWSTMFEYLGTLDLKQIVLGTGRFSGMDFMYSKIHQRLFSHNGFIDILVSSGLIALFLFIIYLRSLLRYSFKSETKIVLWMVIVASIFQSHQIFWLLVVCSILIGELINQKRIINSTNQSI